MSKKNPPYIHLRKSLYYFRYVFPKDIADLVGKKEVRYSLKTGYLLIAQKRSREMVSVVESFVGAIRNGSMLELSHEKIQTLLAKRLRETIEKVESVSTSADIKLLPDSFSLSWAAAVPSEIREINSQSEDTKGNIKLTEVFDAYAKEVSVVKKWERKTRFEYETALRLFVEIAGDLTCRNINHSIALKFKQTLMKLPSNMRKVARYRDKTIQEILSLPDVQPMAVNTINHYLVRLSALFNWAARNGFMDKNYLEGMTLKKDKRQDEYRDQFTKEDLLRLFHSQAYQEGKHNSPYQFWLPIMGLFTGARLEELCQLRLSDFQTIDGVHLIQIKDDHPDKKVKTLSSKRLIPLHPELIRIGLLNYVEQLRDRGEERLFPELKRLRDGYSQAASKWFARYKKRCGINSATKVYHSFRHTFTNQLKQTGVIEVQIAELVGHENSSMTTGRYGKRYEPEIMYEVVKKLDFGINLSQLKFA